MAGYQSYPYYAAGAPAVSLQQQSLLSGVGSVMTVRQLTTAAQASLLQAQYSQSTVQTGYNSTPSQRGAYSVPTPIATAQHLNSINPTALSDPLTGMALTTAAQPLINKVSSNQISSQPKAQSLTAPSSSLTPAPISTPSITPEVTASSQHSLSSGLTTLVTPVVSETAASKVSNLPISHISITTSTSSSVSELDFLADVFADWKKFTA